MESKRKSKSVDIIWTDRDQTASMIWKAYSEHVEKFDEYVLAISMNYVTPLTEGGVYRKASALYYETQDFYDKFESKLGAVSILRVHALFRGIVSLSPENHYFLRRFFSKFMVESGIRDIVMKKDNRTSADKLDERYNLTVEE